MDNNKQSTTLMAGTVRFSYLHVFTPSSMEPEGKKKYSACLIISKKDKLLIEKINACIEAAVKNGIASKWGGKKPSKLKLPLRDGDEERPDDPAFKDAYFMNATSDNKPGIVDANRVPISSDEEFYAGAYGRFHVNFYPFDVVGNKGVAVGLNHLQKLRDGERLAGRVALEDAFDDYNDEGDDDMLG